jgi:hypothetical protein
MLVFDAFRESRRFALIMNPPQQSELVPPAATSLAKPNTGIPAYERELDKDPRWAMSEGSRHFEGKSAVFEALHKICRRLNELQIPYAIVGGMALFRHGFRRFTEDVDLLVTKGDLKTIHEKLEGLGYLPPHQFSKHLRDTESGVRIEFLVTGEYPGDGKPKSVSFPDPRTASFESEGLRYIRLESLVELKLASGLTGVGRMKDLSDVLELVKVLNLPLEFAEKLDHSVQEAYRDLWKQSRRRFVTVRKYASFSPDNTSLEQIVATLRSAADLRSADDLESMRRDGVELDSISHSGGVVTLVTFDPEVAERYGMVEESEFWAGDLLDDERGDGPRSI